MKPLFLILKKENFDQIKSGEKKYEYRITSDYWINRLLYRKYPKIIFQLGYSKNAPRLVSDFKEPEIIKMDTKIYGENAELFALPLSNIKEIN